MGNTPSSSVACRLQCSARGTTVLLDAVRKGDAVMAHDILSAHPSALLRHCLVNDDLPVHVAAKRGNLAILQLIVETVARCAAPGDSVRHSCAVCAAVDFQSGGGGGHVSADVAGAADLTFRLGDVQQQVAGMMNMANRKGMTPLMCAAYRGQTAAVELLLQQGADAWACDNRGRTALHYAALSHSVHTVVAVLESLPPQVAHKGSLRFIDQQSRNGFTPLLCAVAARHLPTVTALLRHKPDLLLATRAPGSAKAPTGMKECVRVTPLHLAARNGDEAIAMELLRFHAESGAGRRRDPRCKLSSWNWRPHETAARYGHLHLAQMLSPMMPLDIVIPRTVQYCGVPTLQCLAAAVLQQRLMEGCDRAAAAAAAAATATSAAAGVAGASLITMRLSSISVGDEQDVDQSCEEKACGQQALHVATSGVASAALDAACCCHEAEAKQSRPRPISCVTPAVIPQPCCPSLTASPQQQQQQALQQCGVCYNALEAVQALPCRHGVCVDCAKELASRLVKHPLPCPFCRTNVEDYVSLGTAHSD